jgi:hypothetical protein
MFNGEFILLEFDVVDTKPDSLVGSGSRRQSVERQTPIFVL